MDVQVIRVQVVFFNEYWPNLIYKFNKTDYETYFYSRRFWLRGYFSKKVEKFAAVSHTVKWGAIRKGCVYTFQNDLKKYSTFFFIKKLKEKFINQYNLSSHLLVSTTLWLRYDWVYGRSRYRCYFQSLSQTKKKFVLARSVVHTTTDLAITSLLWNINRIYMVGFLQLLV